MQVIFEASEWKNVKNLIKFRCSHFMCFGKYRNFLSHKKRKPFGMVLTFIISLMSFFITPLISSWCILHQANATHAEYEA